MLEYWPYATNNAKDFSPNDEVACVYCRKIYTANSLPKIGNELVCKYCPVDAIVIVSKSPLNGLTKPEQQELLAKWHKEGFN